MMGFLNRMKGVFSTGQASAADEAKRLYETGDIAGAVKRLKDALDSRTETGKPLAVISERHDAYSEELHQRRLTEHGTTLSSTPFDASNYSVIEGILSSIDKGLKEGVYSGKTRPEAEGLYKEYQVRFQELRAKVQKEKQQEIIGRLKGMDPEDDADEFVTLVEELRRISGRLPQTMHSDYQVAQERSYVLSDTLKEFDDYIIERRLGSGGFASVFLASPKGVSFQAAIKIFSPQPSLVRESGLSLAELKERFRREAGIMLRLSTGRVPGIVNARHTETWRGKPYLTMDYYPKNLSSLIGSDDELLQTGRGGYLSYDKALPIISRILTSIHGLHNRTEPIIHRDLKPANILLDKNNRPYIGDFGLAREASKLDLLSKAFETVTGTHLATQYYGAPEQRGGFKETDQRADVFSLGVMIYRILTGRLIGFHDLEPIELYVEGLGKDTAGKINDLLNKATKIEVDQRLADISTLLEIFSTEEATVEVSQAPSSGPTPDDQFLTALELAYSFAPDGTLPENVRATLITKSQELGIDLGEAELLEKDFRSRLGLCEDKGDRVISATAGAALKTGEEKGIGSLIITSEPEMATVSVDGIERGKTPLTVDRVSAGDRTIRLKMNGFFPVSRIERILPDDETRIHVILEHQTGSINVSAKTFSDVYPARFYLDEKLMGRPPLTVEDVTAGTHTYRLEADNHKTTSSEVVVNLDEEVVLEEKLDPLPGKLSVVSVPESAAIWIDGKSTGEKTDAVLEVAAGKHTIILRRDGYREAEKEVALSPGKFLEKEFGLEKAESAVASKYGETDPYVRYVATDNGIVKDTKTGLEWVAGSDKDTTWDEAKSWVAGLEMRGGGWRMPTLNELEGLHKEGSGTWNMPPLLKASGWKIWSGESKGLSKAFSFDFVGSGYRDSHEFSYCGRAIAVRSRTLKPAGDLDAKGEVEVQLGVDVEEEFSVAKGQKEINRDSRFIAHDSGMIILDTITGLEWVTGPDIDTNWDEAKSWVQSLNLDGGGWRMPSMDELEGLYKVGAGDGNMTPLLKNTGWNVWSGKTKGSSSAWDFNFSYGFRHWRTRRSSNNGRGFAVRSRRIGKQKMGG